MIRGGLFTRFFLEDGIRQTDRYRRQDAAGIAAFANTVRECWAALKQMRKPSEAETEAKFIYPLLGLLGWKYLPQQEPGKGHRDIADVLLFLDADTKVAALAGDPAKMEATARGDLDAAVRLATEWQQG